MSPFVLSVTDSGWGNSTYNHFRHFWTASFKAINQPLAEVIGAYLGVGVILRSDGRVDVESATLDHALSLIAFLDAYPLQSYKQGHFEVWRVYVESLEDDRFIGLQRKRLPNQSEDRFSYYASLSDELRKLQR